MKTIALSPATIERFWAKVDQASDDGCWRWIAGKNTYGYGTLQIGDRPYMAHRISYTIKHGQIGEGLVIDHICHARDCVNPAHLRAVTYSQNSENRAGATVANKLGVRGVNMSGSKYVARLKHRGKCIYVGRFATLEEADAAVKAKRRELFVPNTTDS